MSNKKTSHLPVPSSGRASSPTASMQSYPGRYRSRLFKFFSRQTRRLLDRGERATREAQVASVWGVQVLVYPVYLLFQSARLAGKQLKQAWQRLTNSQESLNSLPSDTPIQRVLETVEELLPVSTSGNEASTAIPPQISTPKSKIQGIATQPDKRNLVLVDSQNHTLDILTEEQQQKLQKQISLEVANYWHHQRQVQQNLPQNLHLSPPEDKNTVFPPIRLFRQLMAWMQRGAIASAINLFQEETQLLNQEVKNQELQYRAKQLKLRGEQLKERHQQLTVRSQQLNPESQSESEVPATSLIYQIDSALAKLETGTQAIVKVPSYIALRTEEFLQLVKSRLQDSPTVGTDNSPNYKFKIQVLIGAALDYFFGPKQNVKLPEQENQAITGKPQNSNILGSSDAEDWLTEENLFDNSVAANFRRRNLGVTGKNTRSLPQVERTSVPAKKPASPRSIPPASPLPISEKKLPGRNIDDRNSTSDWIETQATPTGYVKHPLERILELLDRGMLFVEELIMRLWRAIEQIFK